MLISYPGGDNRGAPGQSFILNRTASVSVNGGPPVFLRQRSGNAGIILSQPLNVTFHEGRGNSLTVSGFNGGTFFLPARSFCFLIWIRAAAADLDRIIVYGNIYDD